MYATSFKFRYHLNYPKLATQLYEEMAKRWNLPNLDTWYLLLEGQPWPKVAIPSKIQCYVLDNLLSEEAENDVVQVRFLASESAKEYISLYLAIRKGGIANMHMVFPGRGGRQALSNIIQMIKDICDEEMILYADLHMEIQGFSESESLYIKERNLGAFTYRTMAGLNRFIHQSENPDLFRDIRRQARRY